MIRVTDVAYARFKAPDLGRMEAFLVDFGLIRQHRDNGTLYMRGTGPDHHLHVTHLADGPGFIGMAFNAVGMADLEKLSEAGGYQRSWLLCWHSRGKGRQPLPGLARLRMSLALPKTDRSRAGRRTYGRTARNRQPDLGSRGPVCRPPSEGDNEGRSTAATHADPVAGERRAAHAGGDGQPAHARGDPVAGERCGHGEEVHAVLKSDLAAGMMPSGRFGANTPWRTSRC